MEESLTPEEACRLIGEELGVERSCIRPCFDESGSRVSCLVHESWLQRYTAGDPSQDAGPEPVSPWSSYEHQLMLQPSHPEPDAPWMRISILVIEKPIRKAPLRKSFTGSFGIGVSDATKSSFLAYAELLQCVGVENFQHSWDSALDSYHLAAHCVLPVPTSKESDKNVVDELLWRAYGLSARKLDNAEYVNFESSTERDAFVDFKEESEGSSLSLIMKQNVVPFVCALEGKSAYFLVEPYFQHSLHNMVTFSPFVLSGSHMRPLFIIYELLHALHWYHCRGIAHGALTLHSVKISKGLWIYLESPDLSNAHHNSDSLPSKADGLLEGKPTSKPQLDANELACKWTRDDLPNLVELWVHGKITNFDYLMALNVLVGRRMGDPNYHPVFPWVTDFSVRDGGYRDLRKSKFRLNKGDRQLDVTYKAAMLDSQDGAPPHHVSDVLSDITYHVYLARRTPKSVLCNHVRTNWVANEYPSSMERLYHWTPDECIPQFFSDNTIFESIHPDLPDLELPSWTLSADEFIEWHRSVLESEAVSLNLHHWIDLTFGYKLAGKAAVKAKNVYLHLIDKHQSLSNHGVVQLFTEPHPGRAKPCTPYAISMFDGRSDHELVDGKRIRSLFRLDSERMAERSSALEDSVMSLDSIHESGDFILGNQPTLADNGTENNSKPVPAKEAIIEDEGIKGAQFEPICIPDNYNPLDQLERFEALEKFKNQFGPRKDESLGRQDRKIDEKTTFAKLVQADMTSLGCAVVEMLIPAKVQLSACGLTGRQREGAIVKLFESNHKLLPRYTRAGVQALLKGVTSSNGDDATSRDVWLPPLTADLLLQPHLGLFPFPPYFSALHKFLAEFYHSGRKQEANSLKTKASDSLVFLRNEVGYTLDQVDTAAASLPDLLPAVDDEGIKLLLYHLEPLFTCLETRLHACTQLFDMLAQALGPKQTAKIFLKCLVSLFDSHALDIYEVIIRQTFLSQLIVRFGLDGFLKHFISFVVDAVAFKSKVDSAVDKGDRLSVHSAEGVTPGISAPEMDYSPKDGPLDVDDDLDLPGNFLREASEDQDVKIGGYSMGIEDEDLDTDIKQLTLQSVGEGRGDGDKEISEQVTLMPRGITDEEGDERLFQGNISDDDDDAVIDEVDGGHSSKFAIHDGLELGAEVVGDTTGNGDSNSGGTDFEDIELQPVKATTAERTEKTEEASAVLESQGKPDNIAEKETTQDERNDDVKGIAEIQDLEASSSDIFQNSEQDLGKAVSVGLKLLKGEMGPGIRSDNLAAEGESDKNPDEVVEGFNAENEEQDDIDDSFEEANNLSGEEEEEEEGAEEDEFSSEDEGQDDVLEAEEDEANKDEQSGNERRKPVAAAYQIKTFYNGTKSKSLEREKKAEKQRDELTPGAISGIAAESIVWLAPRLGPVLTSKYIASQLLTMLPRCYMGYVGSDDDDDDEKTVNDRNAKWLLFCLGNFCMLYGEAFMLNQYLPFIEKTIRGVQTKVTQRGEAALAGVLSLLKYCIPYLSRDTLCSYSEGQLMTGVFQPVIRILSSYTLIFPGGFAARQAICRSYIDVLTVVCLKLERELARENMTAPLQQFFSCFELERMRQIKENEMEGNTTSLEDNIVDTEDALVGRDEKDTLGADEKDSMTGKPDDLYNSPAYNELYQTFSAAIAHHAFVPLCGIMGSKYMESSLHNHDLIWNLCCSYDVQLSHPTCDGDTRASENEEDGEENGDQVEGVGTVEVDAGVSVSHGLDGEAEERTRDKKSGKEGGKFMKRPRPPSWLIGRKFSKAKDVPTNLSPSSSDQYLRGSWLTHWENQLNVKGKVGNKFSLQQVKLQTFTGHSGPVRSVYVQDSEHCFLSASKDKTVKLWSLSNHGDGTAQSASSWTYYRHTRQVFHVGMVEAVRQAVSCDGSLHLWDPVSGRCLGNFDQPRNNPIVATTTLPAPSQCVVAAMAEGTARFLDVRQQSFVKEWKVTTSSIAGTVRDICCSPDGRWIALGFSSGLTSVLDVRGGLLRSHRRAHTSEIYQVKAFSNTSFVTSSVDSGLSLWKDDGLRLRILKGPSDPLPSILVWRDQVISANMSGRIGVYDLQEDVPEIPYFSYKLSSDVFRGGITCLGYLPLNRLLLIGSDTGNIVLCS